ncbi:FAD/NAD(P)-binding protein [Brachybacterium hainanense]|uniref:FAD/NAD(P)-binding protein n=1 Tax=Brachybacterium hainanense TaxID=1541174 RepID=A0ABV6RFI6_9MICO
MTAHPETRRTVPAAPHRAVAVIGAGPRGTAIVERLVAASLTPAWEGRATVHLVDPHVGLGGAVWRHDQGEVLLMNTTTCQTTMYPDASCHPDLPTPHRETLADVLAAEGLGPADFASRAAHGRYLAHVLETAERDADPSRLRIVRHRAEAVDVTGEPDGPQRVRLDDGRVLTVDALALALGHLATALGPRSLQLADAAERFDLLHIGPANPLEVDYRSLLGRERVAVAGMGLNFYDAIGMITAAAGGVFEEDPGAPSGLRYLPGGGEPQLIIGSRSGMVYRPKPDLGHELPAPYAPRILTSERVLELAVRPAGVDHERDVMPLMLAELRGAHHEAGHAQLASDQALVELLFPFGRRGGRSDDAHRRTVAVLRESLRRAAEPDPAWVLTFRVLTALRIQVNRLVDLGAYTTGSLRRDIDGHLRNAFASWASGPPLQRVRQLLALEEAGLAVFTGPGMNIDVDVERRCFAVHGGTGLLRGPEHLCDGVLEAHLPPVDLPAYRSALLGAWRERGEVQKDSWSSRGSGTRILTGSIAVDGLYAPVGTDGRVFERRFLVGVPVSTAQPGSAITAQPGSSAQLLRHAEAVALRLARMAGVVPPEGSDPATALRDPGTEEDVPWAMQLVVLRDRHDPAEEEDVAETAARAVLTLLDDPRSAAGGPWHGAVRRWEDGGRIRKLVRRADGKRWSDVQALDGVTVASEVGRAQVRAFVPAPAAPLPKALDKLQVGGTTFPGRVESSPRPDEALVRIEVSPLVTMTSGKLAAQASHAAQLAYRAMDERVRRTWRAEGFPLRLERPDAAQWKAAERPVRVIDAGFTELEGPTETARAIW